jgi:hypothetical protein
MWLSIIGGIKELGSLWLKGRKAKAEAEIAFRNKLAQTEADWDNIAQQQAQYSWKDEFITIIWFSPMVVAWFDPERASEWVTWVSKLPYFYQFGMFGIIAASFGLRWYFKQQSFTISKEKAQKQND